MLKDARDFKKHHKNNRLLTKSADCATFLHRMTRELVDLHRRVHPWMLYDWAVSP